MTMSSIYYHKVKKLLSLRTFLPCVVLVFALLPTACQEPGSSKVNATQQKPQVNSKSDMGSPVETIVVTGENREVLTLSARIGYGEDRVSLISSPLQGHVLEVRVKLGDRVRTGETLLVMETPDIAGAYTEFVKEISELSLARRNYDLAAELWNAKAIPMKEYKQAENDLRREQAEFQQAKGKLLSLRVSAEELEKPLEQQKISTRFELKSPLTGTVVERNVTPGQMAGNDAAQVLFTVADLEQLQVVADLYERDLALIRPGQSAKVVVEAHQEVEFPSEIAAIGDAIDPVTRTIKVRTWVKNERNLLKPQMFAKLMVVVDEPNHLLTIPSSALKEVQGRLVVFVEEGPGHYGPREVWTQQIDGSHVRVLHGLSLGERVVANAATLENR